MSYRIAAVLPAFTVQPCAHAISTNELERVLHNVPDTVSIPAHSQAEPGVAADDPSSGRRGRRRVLGRSRPLLLIAAVTIAGVGLGTIAHEGQGREMPAPARTAAVPAGDAVQERALTGLNSFVNWLDKNKVKGYVGEVGWPKERDSAEWNALAEQWYKQADQAHLWVTQWTVSRFWGTTYQLTPYQPVNPQWGGNVAQAMPSSAVLERHPSTADYMRGVDVSGGDIFGQSFGTKSDQTCNLRPGRYAYDWLYDDASTYKYLASRGVKLVRIGVRWERLQPALSGDFDPVELKRLNDSVDAARAAGLNVVVDLHNYGAYWSCASPTAPTERNSIGTDAVPYTAFADVWRKLSSNFKSDVGVCYGLMNEPVDMAPEGGRPPAQVWEKASQTALDAIRSNGDNKLVTVGGYQWSGAATWAENHARSWIADPANNFRYEAHQYFDGTTSGEYVDSYQDELASAKAGK